MLNTLKLLFLLLIILITSCKKDENTSSVPSHNEYLEVTIDGQKLRQDKPIGINVGTQVGQSQLCDGNPGVGAFHTTVENSKFELSASLVHFRNQSDFVNSKTGDYQLTDDWIYSNMLGTKICNLALEIQLRDNSNKSSVVSNSKHSVTSITKHFEDNSNVQYLVEGTFSGNYRNSSNLTYPVSGNYQVLIETVK